MLTSEHGISLLDSHASIWASPSCDAACGTRSTLGDACFVVDTGRAVITLR